VSLRKDGSLDEAAVERNLGRLAEDRRRTVLVDALNELLLRGAARRQADPRRDHESAIVRDLRPPR